MYFAVNLSCVLRTQATAGMIIFLWLLCKNNYMTLFHIGEFLIFISMSVPCSVEPVMSFLPNRINAGDNCCSRF